MIRPFKNSKKLNKIEKQPQYFQVIYHEMKKQQQNSRFKNVLKS